MEAAREMTTDEERRETAADEEEEDGGGLTGGLRMAARCSLCLSESD